jgi:hypothetical protein
MELCSYVAMQLYGCVEKQRGGQWLQQMRLLSQCVVEHPQRRLPGVPHGCSWARVRMRVFGLQSVSCSLACVENTDKPLYYLANPDTGRKVGERFLADWHVLCLTQRLAGKDRVATSGLKGRRAGAGWHGCLSTLHPSSSPPLSPASLPSSLEPRPYVPHRSRSRPTAPSRKPMGRCAVAVHQRPYDSGRAAFVPAACPHARKASTPRARLPATHTRAQDGHVVAPPRHAHKTAMWWPHPGTHTRRPCGGPTPARTLDYPHAAAHIHTCGVCRVPLRPYTHAQVVARPEPRYNLSVRLMDCSGELVVQLFNKEVRQHVLSCSRRATCTVACHVRTAGDLPCSSCDARRCLLGGRSAVGGSHQCCLGGSHQSTCPVALCPVALRFRPPWAAICHCLTKFFAGGCSCSMCSCSMFCVP